MDDEKSLQSLVSRMVFLQRFFWVPEEIVSDLLSFLYKLTPAPCYYDEMWIWHMPFCLTVVIIVEHVLCIIAF